MTCRSIPTEEHQPRAEPSSNETGNPDPEQSPNAEERQTLFVVTGFSEDTISEEDADEVTSELREWLVMRGYPALDVHIDNVGLY